MSEELPQIDVPIGPTDDLDKVAPTAGELLVGLDHNPDNAFPVTLAKQRGSRSIDVLLNLPLRMVPTGEGQQTFDMHHRMIIEEAVRRQMEATMWAVKALTWKG